MLERLHGAAGHSALVVLVAAPGPKALDISERTAKFGDGMGLEQSF